MISLYPVSDRRALRLQHAKLASGLCSLAHFRSRYLFLVEYVGRSGSTFGLRGHGATDEVLWCTAIHNFFLPVHRASFTFFLHFAALAICTLRPNLISRGQVQKSGMISRSQEETPHFSPSLILLSTVVRCTAAALAISTLRPLGLSVKSKGGQVQKSGI